MSAEPAMRASRRGWRDPRLLVGVAIMALSIVAGVLVFSSYDDTVRVLAASHDLPAGASVRPGDVTERRVHFSDPGTADRYVRASRGLPDAAVLGHDVSAGELLPRGALERPEESARVEVPLSVAADDVPATVHSGSVVDVWVVPQTPGESARRSRPARRVLQDVVVVRLPSAGGGLAPRSTRQVIVAVPAGDPEALATALGRATAGRLVLTRKG